MPEKDNRINLTELLLSVKIRAQDIVFVGVMTLLVVIIGGLLSGRIVAALSPYSTRAQIGPWLRGSGYVAEYELEDPEEAAYQYRVKMGTHGTEIVVRISHGGGPVQILAQREFEPGQLALLTAEGNERYRRNFETQIDAVLANVPGWSTFVDDDGQPCPIEESRGFGVEYRIYPDKLSQHEFMNALLDIDRAINYVQERFDALGEELDSQT